ncbi:MrcB family domain-containing protein [Candidatus Nitrospira neomarina]|uniref:DUF3578 domain-containing protein n=1 Tax=Candidatus Nitrospira neomarina TaxID=3020899 RepID=A0AA96GL84_9BACT|nr:DUF3578 domain-containing protein [Candidatus Nitrospira neomarina]WNM63367.1 DUF3578 domain-containing protein [Candidatus Nitrospira neomarina]
MSIRNGVIKIANEYLEAKTQPLRAHPLAAFIRDALPKEIGHAVNRTGDEQQLIVQGTKLPGNWASVPWIGIMDTRLTDSIQRGIYVVLLFAEDMRTVFFSLAMGVQNTSRRTQASWLRQIPNDFPPPEGFATGPLPSGSLAAQGIGARYEQAVVYFKKYPRTELPDEIKLEADLLVICNLLRRIGDSGQYRIANADEQPEVISITIQGRDFQFSADDVEHAFAKTTEPQWKDRPGVEPYWHVIVGDESKPVKAVFRNLPGVSEGFDFTKDAAARAFERLSFEIINIKQDPMVGELCLLGTWTDVDEEDAVQVRAAIASKSAWASWWSFPIREEFHSKLQQPFYFYVNAGKQSFPFRMKVEQFQTSRGNEGMASPWPEITDAECVGKLRAGPKNSEVFKTWLYVTEFESLAPPLTLDSFDPALGSKRTALLNQSAFGYAYRKNSVANELAQHPQIPLNLILYGPPGTGKTHWMRQKFADYTNEPSDVDHETWIQELLTNYGWRPVIAASLAELKHPARVPEIRDHPWVQAKTKQRGRTAAAVHATLWGYLQEHTPETVPAVKTSIRRPPFIFSKRGSGEWELQPDWQELDEESAELARLLQAGPSGAMEPIRRYRVVTFHPSFSYEDFIRGIRPVATTEDGSTQFRIVDGVFKQICDEARANPSKRYALFIDEINRSNIAKVFGELITLIEPDKRAVFDAKGRLIKGMTVQLPGSEGADVAEPPFGVPANLDIFGTMNTADRSIALLDIALRRRFDFQEMEPNYTVLDRLVGNVHLGALLRRLNDRLEYLLDRDHRIGHAYLIPVDSLANLRRAFSMQIIPLLQEYFFDDMGRVAMILATSPKTPPFVEYERLSHGQLFPGTRAKGLPLERSRYLVGLESSWTEESFLGVYELPAGSVEEEGEPA